MRGDAAHGLEVLVDERDVQRHLPSVLGAPVLRVDELDAELADKVRRQHLAMYGWHGEKAC